MSFQDVGVHGSPQTPMSLGPWQYFASYYTPQLLFDYLFIKKTLSLENSLLFYSLRGIEDHGSLQLAIISST